MPTPQTERSMLRVEQVEEAAVIRLLDQLAHRKDWAGTMYIGEVVNGRPSPRMCVPEFRNGAPLPDTWQEIGFSGTKGSESTWSLVLVAEGGPSQWTATWMGQIGVEREPEELQMLIQLGPSHLRMVPSVPGMVSVSRTLRGWSDREGVLAWVALGAARRLGWDLSLSTPPRRLAAEAAWDVLPAGREGDATAVAGAINGWWPGTIIGHQTMSGVIAPTIDGNQKTIPSGPPLAMRMAQKIIRRPAALPVPMRSSARSSRVYWQMIVGVVIVLGVVVGWLIRG